MEVILSIVFLIAAVSLYDYFSARRWQQVTSSNRNEIVFENRNRKYGAYVLRRDYDKSMVYIMASVIFIFGLGFGTFIYARSGSDKEIKPKQIECLDCEITLPEKDELPIVEPPEPDVVKPQIQETAFVEPVVTDSDVIDEVPVDGEMDDKNIGTKDQDGDDTDWGEIDDKDPVKDIIEDDNSSPIPIFVDEEAEFGPGINEFIVRHLLYPQTGIEMNAQGKCYLKFVVNTDGSVSNVSVLRGVPNCPDCDDEAVRVIKQMRGWKPARHNGKEVRSWFQIPINFTLE